MSVSLWLVKHCNHCKVLQETEECNFTYNAWLMWKEIYPDNDCMVPIDGMTGVESLKTLEYALKQLTNFPEKFKKLNPKNGWGSYEDFVPFIKNLIALAKQYPDYTWEADR